MSLNQSKWCVAGGAALLFTCATVAGAQTYQGALRGVVRDIQGVIPGAEVTLVNEDTNSQRTAVTNEVGEYVVASVLPGPYTVRVSLPGFKTEQRTGFRIGTQQTAVLDFTLEVGAISEQLTVTGEAPLVERMSATQATSLDKDDAASPAHLRAQHLLRGDLDSGRHSNRRSAVRALPGSVRFVGALARRRPAPRQRLLDRGRVDHRPDQSADDRALDGSGRGAESPDEDLRGRHGTRRRRRLQHHGSLRFQLVAWQRAAGVQAGRDHRHALLRQESRLSKTRRSTTTTGRGRSADQSSRTGRSSGSAPTTTSSAARATTC